MMLIKKVFQVYKEKEEVRYGNGKDLQSQRV